MDSQLAHNHKHKHNFILYSQLAKVLYQPNTTRLYFFWNPPLLVNAKNSGFSDFYGSGFVNCIWWVVVLTEVNVNYWTKPRWFKFICLRESGSTKEKSRRVIDVGLIMMAYYVHKLEKVINVWTPMMLFRHNHMYGLQRRHNSLKNFSTTLIIHAGSMTIYHRLVLANL